MGLIEPLKKWKRSLDIYITFRRITLCCLFVCILLYYGGPSLSPVFSGSSESIEGSLNKCLENHLIHLQYDMVTKGGFVFNPHGDLGNKYSPFIGNGYFGVSFYPTPSLLLKDSRTLSLNMSWSPLLSVNPTSLYREIYYTDIQTGIVRRMQCFRSGLFVSSVFFAHRTNPHLLYQDIQISNPTDHPINIEYSQDNYPKWISSNIRPAGATDTNGVNLQSLSFSGIVKNYSNHDVTAACICLNTRPKNFQVPPHRTAHTNFPIVIHKENIDPSQYASKKLFLERKCRETMNTALSSGSLFNQQEHVSAWNSLWNSGMSISHSKAAGALNNDHINATLYYVLSNVMANKSEILGSFRPNGSSYISIAEGCYGGYHHTLQAHSLWKKLDTFNRINESVSLWVLTLEKQGCHKLLVAGAEGVLQAMILSFGGFRFSAHHLEFKIDPKFLHRDYFFRKIRIDYNVHINVSVILQEDNKALLGVAIDRTGKEYYACDGGCNDAPVQLRTTETFFPVKITEPITSILYITSDKSHIELIKDTLHVHKIVEAPAHDHHVVALHRHGSHLGGLPILFWASVITLIVIFHLFLCKLICNEVYNKQEKTKVKYSRI